MSTSYYSGFISSVITRAVMQPFDVMKVRLQLQQYNLAKVPKYSGISNFIKIVSKEEGLRAFWKGHLTAQYLSIIHGTTFFPIYGAINRTLKKYEYDSRTDLVFLSSGFAGSVATTVSYPLDLIKTRVIIQHNANMVYRSNFEAVIKIIKEEGFLSLFRGITPALCEVFISSGVQFSLYESKKYPLDIHSEEFFANYCHNFIVASVSGVLGKVCSLPVNTIKKRLQSRFISKEMKYMGEETYFKLSSYNWLKYAVQDRRNLKILFAGSSAVILKAFLCAGVLMPTFEILTQIL